jgi:hypothetical protein
MSRRARLGIVAGLVPALLAAGCHSTPERVPSWLWPPPLGVSVVRGSVAGSASQSADPRVVYLVPIEEVTPLPSLRRPAVVRWHAGAFEPHAVAVRLGGAVRIVNEGAQSHRLFTAGERAMQIDLQGHAEHRLSAEHTGPAHVYCSLHPSEYFFVYTTPARYHRAVAADGSWLLGPVAPGDYHVMLWTPSGEGVVRDIRVWPWTLQSHPRLQLEIGTRGR